jgi:hypothetical protein
MYACPTLSVWVSIDFYSRVYKFLLQPQPATSSALWGLKRTSAAGVGAVLIAPVISKQTILYSLLSLALLVLNLTPGHHTSDSNE